VVLLEDCSPFSHPFKASRYNNMSVRVVARIRPLLKNTEIEKDRIIETYGEASDNKTTVRIPNPKVPAELYSFHFNSVYDDATQAELYDREISPQVRHLFKGFDVTIFAYGVTGTGKTYTMRGGKSLADRGVIPRLLSSIYRRARKIEKDTDGETQVEVRMSYYEIYNDKVYDLFEPPEQRTPAGLPIYDNRGKTVVVGLTERPCTSLKEFEQLYDQANVNRSTSATKLNAHSSRSHAILRVKVIQTTGDEVRISTASAIDLAGSEDNRRTDNNKERLVESASINKSLFVLAQCVEAISKKQARIPYRESKMTRILSLGQNNGLTVMILNLAPVRSYHLDTLSSLNFANRTKKIEVNEVENQPFYREQPVKNKAEGPKSSSMCAPSMNRQPLRPKMLSQNTHLQEVTANVVKPARQFSVYADQTKPPARPSTAANTAHVRSSHIPIKSPKRTSSEALPSFGRPTKFSRPNEPAKRPDLGLNKTAIEALIERKVNEALAERADQTTVSSGDPVSDEVQRRLDALEKKVDGQESERAEGLEYLLMAKQHQVRCEDASALKMYRLALPHFPGNEKLAKKVSALEKKIAVKQLERAVSAPREIVAYEPVERPVARRKEKQEDDESYHEVQDVVEHNDDEDEFAYKPRTKIRRPQTTNLAPHPIPSSHLATDGSPRPAIKHSPPPEEDEDSEDELANTLTFQTPRTRQLLDIINTKDVSRIKLLKGVGVKKAEAIVNCLCEPDDDVRVTSLGQLGKLKGVGVKTVQNMRSGLAAL